MDVEYQHTLARDFTIAGVGLHTGCRSQLSVSPAPANAGISFVLPDGSRVPAVAHTVRSTVRCTTLGSATAEISTVEHVMAALFGMGVDNAIVAIDAAEVPIADGSALPFAQAIRDAGVVEQRVPRRVLELRAPLWLREGDKLIVALPAPEFRVNFFVAFPPPVGNQFIATQAITPDYFLEQIAPNRTFGFRAELDALFASGLARGGSLDNALVVEPDGYSVPLRFPDEIVRHKVLDLIGDFALLGMYPRCEVIAMRTGHTLHVAAAREMRSLVPAVAGAG